MVQNPKSGSWSILLTIILENAVGINISENNNKEARLREGKIKMCYTINHSVAGRIEVFF